MNKELFESFVSKSNTILLNQNSLRFFGVLNLWLEKELIPWMYEDAPEDIKVGGKTDGKKVYFCLKPDATLKEFLFVSLHELLHILNKHINRGKNKNPEVWQLAIDHVVNKILKELSESIKHIEVSEHDVYFPEIAKKYPNASAEDVYEILLNEKNKKEEQQNGDQGEDGNSGNDDRSMFGEDSKGGFFDIPANTYGNHSHIRCFKDSDGYGNESTDESNESILEESMEDLSNKASALWSSSEINKGDINGNLVRILDSILTIKIPWDVVLRNSILFNCQARVRRSWSEANIYLRRPKYRLPGKTLKGKEKKLLCIIRDCSGSISNDELNKFSSIIIDASKNFESICVLTHDKKISEEINLKKIPSKERLFEILSKSIGGGGTSHKEVFDRIEEINKDNKLSTVIFLTDFYSDVERIYESYNWIKNHKSIWFLNSEKEVNLPGCKYDVIRIE